MWINTYAKITDIGVKSIENIPQCFYVSIIMPRHNNGNVKTLRNVFDGFHTDVGYFSVGVDPHFAANL